MAQKAGTPFAKGKKGVRWISIIVGTVFAVFLAVCVSIRDASIHHAAERAFAFIATATQAARPTQTITTEVGERRNVQLVRGTELELNTNSIVHVDVDPESRSVVLEQGEVILNVADDTHGPWVLHCDDLEIQMVSAKVHVRYESMDGSSRLNVISGIASVSRAAQIENSLPGHPRFHPQLVRAGEFLMIRSSLGEPSRFNPAEVDRRLAWTQGRLIFQGDSLKAAVNEFNRYNKRQLVIGDDSIAGLVPGGTFNVTEIDEFVSSLRGVFGVRVVRMPGGGAGPEVLMLVGPDYRGL